MGQFAVIGLGRFGSATALELMRLGHSVLGVDSDERVINQFADRLTQAAIADITDPEAINELGLNDFDVVLVAIGEHLQSSLVCTVHLKAMGIQTIWVKASTKAHHLILTKLGVQRIIHPEEEMGTRIAQVLSYPMVNDYIALGNGDFVVEVEASSKLAGHTLGDALTTNPPGAISALAIKRKTETTLHPSEQFVIQAKDILILFGQLHYLKMAAPKLI